MSAVGANVYSATCCVLDPEVRFKMTRRKSRSAAGVGTSKLWMLPKPLRHSLLRRVPEATREHLPMPSPLAIGDRSLTAPTFHVIDRKPPRPAAILLAVVIAAGALSAVAFGLGHSKARHCSDSGGREGNVADCC